MFFEGRKNYVRRKLFRYPMSQASVYVNAKADFDGNSHTGLS